MKLTPDIKAQLKADLAPVRPLAPAWLYASLFSALLALPAAGLFTAGARDGFQARTGWELLALLLLLGSAAPLGMGLARLMTPGAPSAQVALQIPFWLCAWGGGLLFEAVLNEPFGFGPHEAECLQFALFTAAFVIGLSWLLLRRGFVVHPGGTAALVSLLGGAAGVAALEIACPLLGLGHLVLAHFAAPVLLLLGAGLFTAVFRRRP